jgi:iron complex outermembrane recepter protein
LRVTVADVSREVVHRTNLDICQVFQLNLKTLRHSAAPVGLAFVFSAAAAQESPEAPLQEVVVTGSLIKSAEKVQFNQVQTISPEDIQQSGAVTVADYLRFTAANSASSWGDDFAYGATGGAGIALRGLSEKYTLVLVDGQRVAPYGYPSNGSDTFVDLNTLPLNSIERIEIVKTGAVSQYGSDAIAGVVNIITRKTFQGVELSGGYGEATQGGEATRKLSVLAGLGDLQNDRYNITASASFFLQNGYTQADRSNTRNQNYSSKPFGALTTGADYWEPAGAGKGGAALSPCPSGTQAVSASSLLNGPGSGSACAVNTAAASYLHPHEERIDGKIRATFKVADSLQAFADVWDARNITIASPPTDSNPGYNGIGDSTTAYQFNPLTGGISQISNIVPATNPYNPYRVAVPLTYTFLGAPALETVRSNFYRASAGLEGSFNAATLGDWDWSASVGHSQSTVDKTETGLESVAGLENILDNGVFDFSNPSTTPNGLAGLYLRDQSEGISKLDTVDFAASTTKLLSLPGGPVGVGVGAQFRHESDYVTNYNLQSNALATPFYLQAIDGQRNVAAAYYQVNVPIVSTLTFSQSSRYDHYSDFGSAFSPRFALSYKPFTQLTTYASYGRGFRAPTLAETSQRNSSGVQTAADPHSPTEPNVPETYPELVGGNPHLQPEQTRNYNAGFQWSPDKATAVGLDWYRITIHDAIGTSNIQTTIDANNPALVVRNPNGTIAYVNIDYQNLNGLTTQGFELNFRRAQATGVGTFTLSGDWAYVWNFKQSSGGTTVDFAGNDGAINTPYGASFPRWKGNTSVGWSFGGFDTVLTHLFTGPYVLTQMPGKVSPYSQINLTETYTGFRNLSLYATVSNLFDRAPPYDPLWLEFPNHTPYDPSLYSDEGRYIEVGVTYRFR